MAVPLQDNTGNAMTTLLSSQATLCTNSRTSLALDKQAMSSVFLSGFRLLSVHSFEVSKLIPELLCKKRKGEEKATLKDVRTNGLSTARPSCVLTETIPFSLGLIPLSRLLAELLCRMLHCV